jgi:plasmid stabilization system protein ParE
MKVVFSDRSRARLHEIQSYIAFYDIRAAAKVVDRIIYATEMLSDHPRLGPTWSGGRTRALVVSGLPYRIHYRIDETAGAVEILTVAHTSQKPPRFE